VHPYRPRLSLAGWRELAGFSLWIWAGALAGIVWDRCDPFVLGPRIGAGMLGIYVQALELASLPATELVIPAVDALFAGFSAAQRQEGGGSSVHHAPTVALALLMGLLPLIITISCGSADVVAVLLGPNWVAAGDLVAILAWQGAFAPFAYVIGVTLVANGLVRRNFAANAITSALKLAALVIAVSLTGRLDVVAAVTVGCVAAEAVVFLLLLPRSAAWRPAALAGGFTRATFAAGVAVAVLMALDLAWRKESLASGPAFLHGLLIGAVTLAAYSAALLVAWAAAGRPDGPERQLATLAWRRFRR
jgi:O-antigen/teichoic acid export membrane protein